MGWYSYPVATLYALDGRTVAVRTSDVPAWKSVGWYEMPVTEVFASDGRTMVIASSELETYKNVGWINNIDLPAWGCGEYYWTLSSNERKTARISYPAVQKIAFADWSVWLR